MSLLGCHCGWSKVTTYRGLRIHQGKMGCTPKGMRIPKSQQLVSPPKSKEFNVNEVLSFDDLLRFFDTTTPTSAELRTRQGFREPVSSGQRAWESKPTRQTTTRFHTICQTANFQAIDEPQDRRSRQLEREAEEKRKNEKKRQKEIQDRKKAKFHLEIRKAEQKMLEVQSSAGVCEDFLDAEMLRIDDVFLEVIRIVENAHQTALRHLKKGKKEVRREADNLVKSLKREIETHADALLELDGVLVLGTYPLTNWDESRDQSIASVERSFGTLRVTTTTMIRQIQQEVEKLTLVELKRIPTFAVKLDASRAHHSLAMSADGKQVRRRK